ncbi:class I SAM-dependent methyltransferase [Candidatus Microgenomates bacterium]|nr:class I SAM-dependent methyltransferase [Candidatus Microgenomates bacterium]
MKCIVCGQNKWKSKYSKLVECKNCKFIRAKDKYFKTKSTDLYKPLYFAGDEYLDYKNEQIALLKNFQNRLKLIRLYKKSGKLLEIGSAYGYFLSLAKKQFEAQGIDLDPFVNKLAKKISGVKVITGDFVKTKYKNASFDAVCLFDTIEHLKYPEKYIKYINKILKKNGIIVIETGDIDSLLPNFQKNRWRLITPPFHLQYFSQNTLSKLVERYGFEVIYKTNNISFYRTVRQTIYRLNLPIFIKKLLKPIENVVFPTHTFDLTFLIARKVK